MDNKNKENGSTFNYTYSAKEQEELKRIRQKYAPQEEDKMEMLRRLDRSVTERGTVISILLGVMGTLIMGLGMSLAMVWQGVWFIPGILIGLAGIGILAAAYPVYNRVTRKERERIAPEILRLTDELMK
ncbi:MAG: DUF2244 domain-containing protein [Ruminococcaceae bacterium]|nr:DUF2244 domain-containing protein [Oscillospiraceae bacterium]